MTPLKFCTFYKQLNSFENVASFENHCMKLCNSDKFTIFKNFQNLQNCPLHAQPDPSACPSAVVGGGGGEGWRMGSRSTQGKSVMAVWRGRMARRRKGSGWGLRAHTTCEIKSFAGIRNASHTFPMPRRAVGAATSGAARPAVAR